MRQIAELEDMHRLACCSTEDRSLITLSITLLFDNPCALILRFDLMQNLHKGVLRDDELYRQKLKERREKKEQQ